MSEDRYEGRSSGAEVFGAFSPFIRVIYSRGWERLQEMQIAAAEIIFRTDHNSLLTSSTASGKTEAAFFPILSQFYDDHQRKCYLHSPAKT